MLVIYGSTGYTGRLIVEEALRCGRRPVLAARNADALRAQAGTNIPGTTATVEGGVLLIASSDLSHFHDAHTAAAMDDVVIRHVDRLEAEGLMDALERNNAPFMIYVPTGAPTRTLQSWWLGLREIFRREDHVTIDPMDASFNCTDYRSKEAGLLALYTDGLLERQPRPAKERAWT